jgi:hypothetical protein
MSLRAGRPRKGEEEGIWQRNRAIREKFRSGVASQRELAQLFGLSRGVVSRIISGKYWVRR